MTERFTYDGEGNRTGVLSGSAFLSGSHYTHDAAHRLKEDPRYVYGYDGDGNVASRYDKDLQETWSYAYDANRKMMTADGPGVSATFTYDAEGRRVSKTVNGETTRYAYDGENLVAEYDAGGTLSTRYIHGPGIDNPLAMLRDTDGNGTAEAYYYVKDHLGTVLGLVNANGAFVKEYQYSTFGKVLSTSGAAELDQPFLFTAREYDEELGLYYYRARNYDPYSGRFLQEDPVFDANPYPYVGNSPQNRLDPTGLKWNSDDFRLHYLNFKNSTVDLSDPKVDLINDFANHPSTQKVVDIFMKNVAKDMFDKSVQSCNKNCGEKRVVRFTGSFRGTDYDVNLRKGGSYFTNPLWSIGGADVYGYAECQVTVLCKTKTMKSQCLGEIGLLNEFYEKPTEPLYSENFGGVYRITGNFNFDFSVSASPLRIETRRN